MLIAVLFGNIIDGLEGGAIARARVCVRGRGREGEMDINTRSDIAIVWAEVDRREQRRKGRNGFDFDARNQRARPSSPSSSRRPTHPFGM